VPSLIVDYEPDQDEVSGQGVKVVTVALLAPFRYSGVDEATRHMLTVLHGVLALIGFEDAAGIYAYILPFI
jgi:hypothetical protein